MSTKAYSKTQQSNKTLTLNSYYLSTHTNRPNMAREIDNRHVTDETKQLVEQDCLNSEPKYSPNSMIFSHDSPQHQEDSRQDPTPTKSGHSKCN